MPTALHRVFVGLFLAFVVPQLGLSQQVITPVNLNPSNSLAVAFERTETNPLIQLGPSGSFFKTPNGAPFFAIGHAEGFGFFFQKMNSKETLRNYFQEMKKNGQNTLVVQAENEDLDFYGGHRINLEYPLGIFNEDIAKQFDELLDIAEKHGIYVITYLWDTFHMDYNWNKSPYNIVNGGPCRYISEILTNPVAIQAEKTKFKWAIDRWGNRKNLLAWDLMNEIEWAVAGAVPANKDQFGITHGATSEQMNAWVSDMGKFVKNYELEQWGYSRLRTVSAHSSSYNEAWIFNNKEIDFLSHHQYYGRLYQIERPSFPLFAAQEVQRDIQVSREKSHHRKPVLQTESGPLGWHLAYPKKEYTFDREYHHFTTWSNWAAGAAGTGMRWPYPNYGFQGMAHLNPLTPQMEQSLSAVAAVSKHVRWNDFRPKKAVEEKEFFYNRNEVWASASRDETKLIAWITKTGSTRNNPVEQGSLITLRGFKPGEYVALWFDDMNGKILKTEPFTGSDFELTSPVFEKHIALVFKQR